MERTIFTTESGSARDSKLDVYQTAAIEMGIPRQDMVAVQGTFATSASVELTPMAVSEAADDNEGAQA